MIVNVVYGEMSDERWLAHAKRLNPRAALTVAMPFLRLHIASGRVSQWGMAAYQVNALSLSADRKLVAYAGSGGEVGVLRVASREPVFEKRRRGEHWSCALTPSGARLYLGDKDGIGVLDPRTGAFTRFVLTGKPGALAISPDGKLLAASSWESPLRVFDTTTQRVVWEVPDIVGEPAFSPDGRSLAVANALMVRKAWVGRLACYDAANGRVRWTARLGSGRSASFAWALDGSRLLGAASVDDGASEVAWYAAADGARDALPWTGAVEAVAVSPSGTRLGVCADSTVAILDDAGKELARGTGTQESLTSLAFANDRTLLAAGRDVNSGPAILQLRLGASR